MNFDQEICMIITNRSHFLGNFDSEIAINILEIDKNIQGFLVF